MSTEPTHFLTLMNNGKAFSSLDDMQLPVLWPVSVSTGTLTNQGIGFLETLETKLIYLKIILITPGIIWSLKFKKIKEKEWWNRGITNTNIFPRRSFSWGDEKFFGQKNYGKVVLNWRTNDQIVPRFGRSFIINDKCIFQ